MCDVSYLCIATAFSNQSPGKPEEFQLWPKRNEKSQRYVSSWSLIRFGVTLRAYLLRVLRFGRSTSKNCSITSLTYPFGRCHVSVRYHKQSKETKEDNIKGNVLTTCTIPSVSIQYVTKRQLFHTRHFITIIHKATFFGCTRQTSSEFTLQFLLLYV
jgi:hypothetical protein